MRDKNKIERARLSLEGLSVGDAFGQQFFTVPDEIQFFINRRKAPEPPWYLTDDSIMAIGIVEVLDRFGFIEQNELAKIFARNYMKSPRRGYGGMAHHILREIYAGKDWREVSSHVFDGMGSFGNGGAMRVAPLGAYFPDDFEKTVEQARLSAEVTHYHLEGQAGAIAVAVAAAYACSQSERSGKELLETVVEYTPDSDTRSKIKKALSLPFSYSVATVANVLGNGSLLSSADTVPFCLWSAARHLHDFEEAMWTTVSALGDRDTTCAIVGGIVSLSAGKDGIPKTWLRSRESVENWEDTLN